MQEPSALGRVVELVRDLRQRCPWDAAQTRETLRPYLVEEVMELDQALSRGDLGLVRAELGDLLLHLAFQIVLGEESGSFGAEDVTRTIEDKMRRRHPHLFDGGERPESWERQKLQERSAPHHSVLDGLPPGLPPLIAATRLQERAAGVGFDWPDVSGPLEKVREELGELAVEIQGQSSAERIESEVGDLLFAAINLARKAGCDARSALEKANQRFLERFRKVETMAGERGIDVGSADLKVLDELWEEAKRSLA